jgi:hypothetical protein
MLRHKNIKALDDAALLVFRALESLQKQGRISPNSGVPLLEIVENAGEILGGDWFEDDDFDNRIEAGMQQLVDIGAAEGPDGIVLENWWADTSAFTLRKGYRDILGDWPGVSDKTLDETFVGDRSRTSLLSQPQPLDGPSLSD